MASHSDGGAKGEFCALRADNCGHAKYREVCAPNWQDYSFWRGKTRIIELHYNAHHLLCVATVTGCVLGAADIESIIRETEWCVNRKKNMYAMPLWGHTLKHYMNVESGKAGAVPSIARRHKESDEPAFADVPQHDSDHHSYQYDEVEGELLALVDQIKQQKAEHEIDPQDIAAELDDLSDYFRSELEARGQRCGGTHAAWSQGREETNPAWYLPFSMAMDGRATKRTFPLSNQGDIAKKVLSMVNSFLNRPR